jgi:hypothetical protein
LRTRKESSKICGPGWKELQGLGLVVLEVAGDMETLRISGTQTWLENPVEISVRESMGYPDRICRIAYKKYPLANVYITNWKDPQFVMGTSTINGHFLWLCSITRG